MRPITLGRFIAVILFSILAATSHAFESEGLLYTISDSSATVTGAVDSKITSIVIPATVEYRGKTYNVTTVGKNAFQKCVNAEKLVIEDSDIPLHGVWYTNSNGFQVQSLPFKNSPLKKIYVGRETSTAYNSSITGTLSLENAGTDVEITIAGGTRQINQTTLKNVNALTVTLGSGIQEIRIKTFAGQKALRKVVIESGNTNIQFLDSDAFPDSPLDSAIVNRPLHKVGGNSPGLGFYQNKQLKNVICGSPIITRSSFCCPNLESFRVLSTCNKIEFEGAGNNTKLYKTFLIDDCDTPLELEDFPYALLDTLYLGRPVSANFRSLYRAKKIEFGPGLTVIPDFLCYGHSETEEVNLGDLIRSIGQRAFYGCKALTSVHIPQDVASIGKEAFANCTSLESINIPAALTSIPERMLENCKSLKGVLTISPSVRSIGNGAFDYCSFSRLIIEDSDSVLQFGSISPISSTKFEYVYIGRQPRKIASGYDLLSGRIDTLILGSNVFELINNFGIGSGHVKHLTLSPNIERIPNHAFSSCSELESLNCQNLVPAVVAGNDNAGFSVRNYTDVIVTVPTGTKRIYQADKTWKNFKHIRSDEYIIRTDYDPATGLVELNGEVSNGIRVKEGTPLYVSATPALNHILSAISVDGNPVELSGSGYEISEVNNDHDIKVDFVIATGIGTAMTECPLIYVDNGRLTVNDPGKNYTIHNIWGTQVYNGSGEFSIILPEGIFLLHDGSHTIKIKI